MVNMREVAAAAGVSRYTVSKFLNGVPVKESTNQKILSACEKLDYRRNLFAVNLVSQKSQLIGMVISQSFDSFFGDIIAAAENEAHKRGYFLLCQCSYGSPTEEARIIDTFLSMQVCGLCVAPVSSTDNLEQWTRLEKKMPVVYFDCYLKENSNYIMNDNFKSAQMVTEYLLSLGVVPHCLGSVHTENNIAIKKRNQGYRDTMVSAGYEPIFIPTNNTSEKLDSYLFGYENMTAYLQKHDVPEALFCATDRAAVGAMKALSEKGFVIGRDVLVAGHDDLSMGGYLNPSLTSVAQPKNLIGEESVKAILSLLNSRTTKIQKVLSPKLIVRDSTCPPQK
jgi:LacI family transcriptional regulator/LacI family repressor for deo operon, udp, cdd, tsx, nupC, and nupG